jgi:hypothetical protein
MSPLPVATKADTQTLSEASKSADSSFQVLYFGLHGRGEFTRNILNYAGAKYEDITPVSLDHITLNMQDSDAIEFPSNNA